MESSPFILFAQHGWADTYRAIANLASALATPYTQIVAPDLGWFKTWLRIEPLIQQVETIATQTIAANPNTPLRIIGHSMGGLIWLELLARHPEWRSRVHSLVLIASPVGGAELGRIFDPLQMGIGIARDLGINRRPIAETIAKEIPTLVIAGDSDGGSDCTIAVETTQFSHAHFICLTGMSHAVLKNHPSLVPLIRDFWANPAIAKIPELDLTALVIQRLQSVTGMTAAHRRDFCRSKPLLTFDNGMTLRLWKNPVRVEHVFLASYDGQCLYGGFVGWQHANALHKAIAQIEREFILGF